MNKKRILMIVSNFYPNGSIVEAKNNYLTMLELQKGGFDVDVCTFESKEKYPNNVKYQIKRKNKFFSKQNRYYNFFRKKIKLPLLFVEFLYVDDFLDKLNRVNISQYSYIYTVFGDGSEHIVGVKLKEKYKHLKHIAEFRDPWIHNVIGKKYFFDHSLQLYANYKWKELKKSQQKLMYSIDVLLVESDLHGEKLKNDFNYTKEIFFCNGFSELFENNIPTLNIYFENNPIIGFIGSTYYGYDDVANIFIEVLEELEEEGSCFTFISVGKNHFSKLIQTSKLKNFYSFEKVPYFKALSFMKKIDIGLALIMQSYEQNINSKIFEYMQHDVFTIAIAPKNGAMDKILTPNHLGIILSYEKKEMKKEMKILLQEKQNFQIKKYKIEPFNRKNVFKPIINAMKDLV